MPVASWETISSASFEPIIGIEPCPLICPARLRMSSTWAKTRSAGASITAVRLSTGMGYSLTRLSRKALPMTLTEDSAMAAAAMMGDNRIPNKG